MRRRTWIGTSWKMNKTRADTVAYLTELRDWWRTSELDADIAVFPPFTALPAAAAQLAGTASGPVGHRRPTLSLGAQNMHWQPAGAYTGEISAEMLLDCGVRVVEIGHYERRTGHGEDDRSVNLKARATIAAGLDAVICVGESADDLQFGVAAETVSRQVKIALRGLPAQSLGSVVLAYEPGWAIGTGGTQAEPDAAEAVHAVIRTAVSQSHGPEAGERIRIVYGGSADADSAGRYASGTSFDGLFVGRAALTSAGLIAVTERFCAARLAEAGQLICEGDRT